MIGRSSHQYSRTPTGYRTPSDVHGYWRVASTPARKEMNRTVCGHTWKKTKIMRASGAIEDISMKSRADSRDRRSGCQTTHTLGPGAKGSIFKRAMKMREPERTWNFVAAIEKEPIPETRHEPDSSRIPLMTMTISATESTEKATQQHLTCWLMSVKTMRNI